MTRSRYYKAGTSHFSGVLPPAPRLSGLAALVLGGLALAGCTTAPAPAPVYYSSEPVPNPPKRVRHPPAPPASAATPASASTGGAPSEAAPAAPLAPIPQTQLPAEAEPPTIEPPPGGLPHDSSEYIEPPSR